jgi:hypothetical protein
MVQLVLVYCLVANGAVCSEQHPDLEGMLTLSGCMAGAQQVAATYVTEHPQWYLSRWRCEIGKPRESHA